MHGRRHPSFLTKKNPADAGEMDGLMKPLASSSSMYAYIASDSGCDRGNTMPLVGIAPGSRSMAQSLARCGGSCETLNLLNASERSSYSTGRSDIDGVSDDERRFRGCDMKLKLQAFFLTALTIVGSV